MLQETTLFDSILKNNSFAIGSSYSPNLSNSSKVGLRTVKLLRPSSYKLQERIQLEKHDSEDSDKSFSPSIYDRSSEFLDQEGLDIVSPGGLMSKRIITLKPCDKKLGLNTQVGLENNKDSTPEDAAVPSFLLKRKISKMETQSSGEPCVDTSNCCKLRVKLFAYTLKESSSSSFVENESSPQYNGKGVVKITEDVKA